MAASEYVHGYNGRAPIASVLIVEARPEALRGTVARYLQRCSFAMAALPAHVAAAARMFAFDGVVVPATLDPELRAEVLARLGGAPRVFELDDVAFVARQLRAVAGRAIALRA